MTDARNVSLRSEGALAEAPRQDGAALIEVISRAASDPNTDVAKLSQLMDLYERVEERQFEREFNAAMSTAQAAMEPVRKDAKSDKGKYASYSALDAAIRPIYTGHGFGLSFDTGDATKPDDIRVICYATHRSGAKRTYHVDMPADGKGAKGGDVMTRTHATGSALTYGQRYLLRLIFNIVVTDDDDGAGAGRVLSAGANAAMVAINALNAPEEFRQWREVNASMLNEFPTAEADHVVRHFNSRLKKVREAQAGAQ